MIEGWASGVRLAVTGLSRSQRVAIQGMIQRGGGTYTATLSHHNTHLLVPNADIAPTPKFQAAMAKGRAWGLTIVTLAWALDSDRQQRRQPEARYAVLLEASERPLAERAGNVDASMAAKPPPTPTTQLANTLSKLSLSQENKFTSDKDLVKASRVAGGRVAAMRGVAVAAVGGASQRQYGD